ncbi:glycoside hydrolase family 18 [Niabella sp.]|uniref:glycoside hydrolase family 18 n=1 Tax=Niabella sp. TaxID=1962976 RepID=UPI00262CBAC4|nr:glycoside hydrolase family 18 [Niabella sp.]
MKYRTKKNLPFRHLYRITMLICFGVFLCIGLAACKKQTIQEPIYITDIQKAYTYSEAYYTNLRTYKKSDHQVLFSWIALDSHGPSWGNHPWGLPDSIDIVSMWGDGGLDDADNLRAIDSTRKLKGTRFVAVSIIGAQFDGIPEDTPVKEAIAIAVKRMVNHVYKYGLDGYDIDYEPNLAPDALAQKYIGTPENLSIFIKELSRFLGPKSGTGKLLILDGEIDKVPPELGPYFDYLVAQAYFTTGPGSLQGRYDAVSKVIPPEKFIVTEEYQKFYTGLYDDNTPNTAAGPIPSLLGMAWWQPAQGRKGGCGAYHGEIDYNATSQYNTIRRAIQIMNPAAIK